jgi:hypothetical protein
MLYKIGIISRSWSKNVMDETKGERTTIMCDVYVVQEVGMLTLV